MIENCEEFEIKMINAFKHNYEQLIQNDYLIYLFYN